MLRARQRITGSHKRKGAADQPRPALGRRPWFALLRRARSLRRFAFAIRRERVAASWPSLTLVDRETGWSVSPVHFATGHRDRRRGVRAGHEMVLLRTTMVHSRGLDRPLRLVAIDASGTTIGVRVMPPRSFARLRGASWTLELPCEVAPPAVGASIGIYPR